MSARSKRQNSKGSPRPDVAAEGAAIAAFEAAAAGPAVAAPVTMEVPAVDVAAPPPAEPTPEPAASPPAATGPWLVRLRAAAGKAVLSSFAAARTAQARAIVRATAWVGALDAGMTRTLGATERYLIATLRLAPPAPADAPAETAS